MARAWVTEGRLSEVESFDGTRRVVIDARKESNESPRSSLSRYEPRSRVEIGCVEGGWHAGLCYFKANGVSAGYSECQYFDSG